MSPHRRNQSFTQQPPASSADSPRGTAAATRGRQPDSSSLPAWLAAATLAISIGVVYGPALDAPFIFDDLISIQTNKSITSLWPLVGTAERPGPLNPETDLPTAGRPLVNLSFALNYYFGELSPTGYHAWNAILHFGSAMLLWAIVQRTLRLPYFTGRFDAAAGSLALAVAMLWSLHPLQTEAVIYTTQRTELMMAFFYLATLYCSLRYWSALPLPPGEGRGEGDVTSRSRSTLWLVLAVLTCLAGMASKEVMVSAPLVVLLFDRTFIAGSLAKALRRSWPLYLGLAATWIVLVALNINAPRRQSAGFGLGPPAYMWWFTQSQVLLMYLKLVVWPSPLLIHYELPYLKTLAEAWIYVVPVVLLGIVTLVLLWRNSPVGFLGTWVFTILAPTSLVPILTEMAAERRMYLPLAAIAVLFVIGGYLLFQSALHRTAFGRQSSLDSSRPTVTAVLLALLLALVCGLVSSKRLDAYADEMNLWQQVLQHQPDSYLAHYNLGMLLNYAGRESESFAELQAAVAAKPDFPDALSAFGFALINRGQLPEALDALHAALAIKPDHVAALNNLGLALMAMGKFPEAIEHLEHALRVNPDFTEARKSLGRALANAGRSSDAIEQLQAALVLNPDDPTALNDLGMALAAENRLPEAIELLERAVLLRPDYAAARNSLGLALYRAGYVQRAVDQFRQLAKLNPRDTSAFFNLGNVFLEQGDAKQAVAYYAQAVELRPDFAEAQYSLGMAQQRAGHAPEAIPHLQASLKLKPGLIPAYLNLAQALAAVKKPEEAIAVAQQGINAARSSNQDAAATEMEAWLKQYRNELQQSGDAKSSSQSEPPAKK